MTASESQGSPEQTTASTRDERIQSPHDRLINQTLQRAEATRDLLARHLQAKSFDTIKVYVMSLNPVVGEEKMSELEAFLGLRLARWGSPTIHLRLPKSADLPLKSKCKMQNARWVLEDG